MLLLFHHSFIIVTQISIRALVTALPLKHTNTLVFDSRIVDHPHIWGKDELKKKLPDGVLASEAISS